MTASASPSHSNVRAILIIVLAMFLGTIGDVVMRFAMIDGYPPSEVLFVRGVFTLAWLAIPITASGLWGSLGVVRQPLVLARSLFDALQAVMFAIALQFLPLGELMAAVSALPIWMTLLAIVLLGERVGRHRWAAIAVGFIGMLLIVKPSPNALNYWALIGLACGFVAALRDLTTSRIHLGVSTLIVGFIGGVAVSLLASSLSLVEPWRPLAIQDAVMLGAGALANVTAMYLLITALRLGEISVIAPFRYTLVLWGLIIGYLVFRELPDPLSLIGAALIVAGGVYTFHREAVKRRYLASKPTTPT